MKAYKNMQGVVKNKRTVFINPIQPKEVSENEILYLIKHLHTRPTYPHICPHYPFLFY